MESIDRTDDSKSRLSRRALGLAALACLLFDLAFYSASLFDDSVRAPFAITAASDPLSLDREVPSPHNPVISDWSRQFRPWRQLVTSSWKQGRPPLWNDKAALGQPLAANMQCEAYSPYLPIALIADDQAPDFKQLFQILIAQVLMLFLARRLGLGVLAAFVAAIAYSYSSYMQVWAMHPHSGGAAFAPGMVHALIAMRSTASRRAIAGGAILIVLSVLSGHLETAVKLGFVAFVIALGSGSFRPRPLWRYLRSVFVCTALGLLASAILLLPFLEYLQHSDVETVRRIVAPRSLETLHLASLFDAHALGAAFGSMSPYRAPENFAEGTVHVGRLALLLGIIGLIFVNRLRARLVITLIALSGVGLFLASASTEIAQELSSWPFLELFPLPRLTYLAILPLALLAALGVESLGRIRRRPRARIVLALIGPVIALGLFVLDRFVFPAEIEIATSTFAIFGLSTPLLALSRRNGPWISVVVIAGLMTFEAWTLWRDFVPNHSLDIEPTSLHLVDDLGVGDARILAAGHLLPPELGSQVGHRHVRGYDAIGLRRHHRLLRASGDFQGITWTQSNANCDPKSLDLLGVKWIISPFDPRRACFVHRRERLAPAATFELPFNAQASDLEFVIRPLGSPNFSAALPRVEIRGTKGAAIYDGEFREEGSSPGHLTLFTDPAFAAYERIALSQGTHRALRFRAHHPNEALVFRVQGAADAVEVIQIGRGGYGEVTLRREQGGFFVAERTDFLDEAYRAPPCQFVDDDEESLKRIFADDWSPRRETLIEVAPSHAFPVSADTAIFENLPWRRPSPGIIEVDWGGAAAGTLVVAEAWAPGWRAEAEGQELPLAPANLVAQAIAVPEGTRWIRMSYRPSSFLWGAALSLFGALIIALLAWKTPKPPSA